MTSKSLPTSVNVIVSEATSNNMEDVWKIFDDFDETNNLKKINNKSINSNCNIKCINSNCNSKILTLIDYNYICLKCNTVQDKFIDNQAEWRYYGSEDSKRSDPTRCGMPTNDLLPELSLGSVIGTDYIKSSYEMYKIRKYQQWNSTSYKERTLCNIIDNITLNASNSGISQSIIDDAKVFYKKVSEKKISRGSNRNGLIASSIYMSCKANKVPRSAKEIAKVFNINITTMTKGCKKFHDIMKTNMLCSNPEDFIMRFCYNLNIEDKYIDLCINIINKADEYSIVSENAPPSIAAGTIFLVSNLCKLGILKKDISKNCDISEVTINKCYKNLDKYKKHLIKKEDLDKYNITL
jgi:transcription initiation factor TFIIB|tara:strand:+ start:395 stop:1450 length:1056 start_codon:yes stop_codon:yes gene_type:complete